MSLFKVYVDGSLFYHPNISKLAITEAQIHFPKQSAKALGKSLNYSLPTEITLLK